MKIAFIELRIKYLLKIFLLLYIPIILLIPLVYLCSLITGIPINHFTRDPSVIASEICLEPLLASRTNPLMGFLSNIGILLWSMCASSCLLTSFLAKHIRRPRKGKYSRFFGTFGIITLILLLDDLFLFHEVIAPGIFMISETIVYGGYGLVILASLINFRKIILQSEWGLFGLAFVFLGLSIVIDSLPVLDNMSTDLNYLIEDGFKLLGIVSWFGYFMIFSYQVLKPELILKKG